MRTQRVLLLSVLVVGVSIGLVASMAAVPLPPTTLIGGFNSAGFGGAYGFIYAPVTAGAPGKGIFGAAFSGPTLVSSMTITQYTDAGRKRPQNVRVYTDHTHYVTITLADTQAAQTVDFTAFNGGQPILASPFLVMTVQNEYGVGDPNFGVMSYSFDGTPYAGPPEINLNTSPASMSMQNPLGGYSNTALTVDGKIVSHTTSDSVYWTRNATNPDSLTVNYSAVQTVGVVGLGFAADGSNRDLPKFVTVSDSNGHSEVITLDPLQSQYERYILTSPFANTLSLTVTMPTATGTGIDATNWYINGDTNYGITEFQAFAPLPEPGAFALLAAGILAVVRRRR